MRVDLALPLQNAALLARVAGGGLTVYGHPTPPRGASIDSRLIQKGDLFVALRGENCPGSDYIPAAVAAGATAILTDVLPQAPLDNCACITVPNVPGALLKWAAYRRSLTRARVIAVSGSTGKTTAKEGIFHLCEQGGTVTRTSGNHNSTIGMPLSVLSFEESDVWVIEIGVNHPGEMAPMAAALAPDVAVLTNVGTAHVGHFESAKALLEEKAALACGMGKEGILLSPACLKQVLVNRGPRLVTFGEGGDFAPFDIRQGQAGVCLSVAGWGRVWRRLCWPLPGRIGVAQVSLLTAVGAVLGYGEKAVRAGISAAGQNTPRLRRYQSGERLLIDDTYNASPEATAAALETLTYLAGPRPAVAVLGDMLELGKETAALHEAVGKAAAGCGLAGLWCCGQFADKVANGARKAGFPAEKIHCAEKVDTQTLARVLLCETPHNAVILFKAAHAVGLGETVRVMLCGN